MRFIKRIIPLSALAVFAFSGCGNPVPKKKIQMSSQHEKSESVTTHIKSQFELDTTDFPINILTTGMFHNDEVSDNASNMKWIGLFKGSNGYYLKETKLKSIPVYDPVLDEDESITTGWEVSTAEKDTNILLIQALPYLKNQKIRSVPITKNYIYPGETLSFNYRGIDYSLSATGNKKKESDESDWYVVSNYKLYLTAKINGKPCKTLLTSQKMFDDAMVSLIFAGDLDGDGILDMILDNTYHYNLTDPTLYLSRPAGKGQVVKSVGSHASVGC